MKDCTWISKITLKRFQNTIRKRSDRLEASVGCITTVNKNKTDKVLIRVYKYVYIHIYTNIYKDTDQNNNSTYLKMKMKMKKKNDVSRKGRKEQEQFVSEDWSMIGGSLP